MSLLYLSCIGRLYQPSFILRVKPIFTDAMPDDPQPDNDQNNNPPVSDAQSESVEAEVVEHNPALSAETEALATFSEQDGPLSFRILPVIEGGATDWRILVYMRGVQGPVYQSRDGLTDGAASEFGISSRLQERVNDALQYAKDNLEVPEELGDQKRAKRTLNELEAMMGE